MYGKIREKRNALFFGSLLQMRNMYLTWIMEVRCIDERRLKRNEWARKRGENMIEKRWNAIARTIFGRARNWCACRASSLGSSVIVALLSQGNARGRATRFVGAAPPVPNSQLSRNFSLPSSFASVVSIRLSFAFISRFCYLYSNAITITFFSRHNVFRFPFHPLQIERKEKKEETGYQTQVSQTWIFPSFRE